MTMPFPSAATRLLGLTLPLTLGLTGCGDDGSSPAPAQTDTDIDSGFNDDDVGTSNNPSTTGIDPSTTDPTTTAEPTSTTNTNPTDSGYDTLGEGDLRGLLTFTLYPADPLTNEPIVGMAGAWRDAESELTDVDDFFAVFGLGRVFPQPPADLDALEHNGIPAAFDWGAPFDWLLAGTAMKLRLPDTEPQACLLYRGGSPEVELPPQSGTFYPNYPVYASTFSENQPEGCAPDPATWMAETEYDIVLYGGEMFDTNSLVAQVHTPAVLEVTSPDVTQFALDIDVTQDLEVAWTGEGAEDSRVVIRLWDAFDRMLTIHATDDGSYTIPADDVAMLSTGAATLSVARERVEEVPFTDGVVRVVTRYDQWGYLELF